jgi:hypothetical protein
MNAGSIVAIGLGKQKKILRFIRPVRLGHPFSGRTEGIPTGVIPLDGTIGGICRGTFALPGVKSKVCCQRPDGHEKLRMEACPGGAIGYRLCAARH